MADLRDFLVGIVEENDRYHEALKKCVCVERSQNWCTILAMLPTGASLLFRIVFALIAPQPVCLKMMIIGGAGTMGK